MVLHRPIETTAVTGEVMYYLNVRSRTRSSHFRRTRARCRRTRPIISAVFAQDAADKKNERKNDPLNSSWRHRKRLCVSVPPRHVCHVEDRRPAGRAGVEYRKYRLEVAIQVTRRNCPATQLQNDRPRRSTIDEDRQRVRLRSPRLAR